MDGAAAHSEALYGRFDPQQIAQLAHGSAVERAWAAAIQCAFSLAAPDQADPVDVNDLQQLASESGAAHGVAAACGHLGRIAWLTEDADALDTILALQSQCEGTPAESLELEANRARSHLIAGTLTSIREPLAQLEATAARLELGHLVVELASMRALADAEADVAEAVRHARRATRMARTEGFPQAEYLAYWTLARLRRLTGKGHLTVRILTALHSLVPKRWGGMIGWELLFAQGPAFVDRFDRSGERKALILTMAAAQQGDHEAFLRHASAAVAHCPRAYRNEVAAAVTLLGASFPGHCASDVEDWMAGHAVPLPYGLRCLRGDAMALMSVAPGRPGQRLAGLAAAFLPPVTSSSRPGRIETAFCVLATGKPLKKAAFFEEVYGFPYDPELHHGSLEVVVHRLRHLCDELATVERVDEALKLVPLKPLAVPDPRCESGQDDRLLQILAEGGGGTARDLATAAGIPLRTAQSTLKQFVRDGVCVASRKGRSVEYRVEDTTFSEPTRVGRAPT